MDLKLYLKEKNLSMEKFAAMVDISRIHLSGVINGHKDHKPSYDLMVRIEKATKGQVTAQDIINSYEEKRTKD